MSNRQHKMLDISFFFSAAHSERNFFEMSTYFSHPTYLSYLSQSHENKKKDIMSLTVYFSYYLQRLFVLMNGAYITLWTFCFSVRNPTRCTPPLDPVETLFLPRTFWCFCCPMASTQILEVLELSDWGCLLSPPSPRPGLIVPGAAMRAAGPLVPAGRQRFIE